MGFLSVLSFAQQLVAQRVKPGEQVVDATLGNGVDACFLAKTIGSKGTLYGFDIQPEAIDATQKRLEQQSLAHIPSQLFLQSHEHILRCLPMHTHGEIAAVMFNLGYLPGSSSDIITSPDSTIKALQAAKQIIRLHGVITIVLYPGHEGGEAECLEVEQWTNRLPSDQFQVIQYRFTNRPPHTPYCMAIEKTK